MEALPRLPVMLRPMPHAAAPLRCRTGRTGVGRFGGAAPAFPRRGVTPGPVALFGFGRYVKPSADSASSNAGIADAAPPAVAAAPRAAAPPPSSIPDYVLSEDELPPSPVEIVLTDYENRLRLLARRAGADEADAAGLPPQQLRLGSGASPLGKYAKKDSAPGALMFGTLALLGKAVASGLQVP